MRSNKTKLKIKKNVDRNLDSKKLFTDIDLIVGALFLGIITSFIYYKNNILGVDDKYKEFIIGDTVYSNYNKITDLRLILILLIVSIVAFVIIYKLYNPKNISYEQIKINKKILYALNIIYPILALLLRKYLTIDSFKYYLISYTIYLLLIYYIMKRNESNNMNLNTKKIILIIIFSTLSSLILEYVSLKYFHLKISNVVFCIAVLLLSFYKINTFGIYISQIFLPLYILKIIDNKYSQNGELIYLQNTTNLKILVFLLLILSLFLMINEFKKANKSDDILLSSLLVIMLILIWNNVPAFYNLDEYHTGEIFTNYDQIITNGQLPYMQYIPVKGYYHLIIGFINQIFYDGGYSSIGKAYQLNNLIFMIPILFILIKMFKRETIVLILLLNLVPLPGNYFLIFPVLCLLSGKKVLEDEYKFIVAYLYTCYFSFMYYQSFGIAIGIGLFPVLFKNIYKILKNKIFPTKNVVYAIIPGIILGLISYKQIYYGLKYSLMNASANTLYWGNQSLYSETDAFLSFFKIIQSHFWSIIVIFAVIYLMKNYQRMQKVEKLINLFIIFYPLSISSYITGRLDVTMGRPMYFTHTIIGLLLVLFLYKYEKNESNRNLLGLSFILCIYFVFQSYLPQIDLVRLKSETIHPIPDNMVSVDAMSYPKIGSGFIDETRLQDLISEKIFFDTACKSKEDIFLIIDLYTTDSARYSLFGYRIPTLSHSVLNIPSISSQKWELERVSNFNVPIIRVSSGINRYYLFHKEFLNGDYIYTTYNKREYLIKKDIFEKMKMKFNLEENILPESYSMREAGVLPIKWGNSFESNKEKILKNNIVLNPKGYNNIKYENGSNYILKEEDPYIIFNFDNVDINSKTDFIKFNLRSNEDKVLQMQLFWADSSQGFSEENSIRFNARNGDIVIPVGFNLGWRNMEKAEYLRFDIDGLEKGKEFEISNVEFLSLDSN